MSHRARFLGAVNRAFEDRRLPHLSRSEHGVKHNRLAANIAAGEVGCRPEADPSGVNVELSADRHRRQGRQHRSDGLAFTALHCG